MPESENKKKSFKNTLKLKNKLLLRQVMRVSDIEKSKNLCLRKSIP
jgi:hypothetical protein